MIQVYRPLARPLTRTLSAAESLAGALIDVALPPRCAACGAAGSLICPDCRAELVRADGPRCSRCWILAPMDAGGLCPECEVRPPAVRALRSGFVYDGAARAAVLSLKHGGAVGLAGELVSLAAEVQVAADIDIIVPVPMPLLRRRRRGGNQAEHLARALSERAGLPVDSRALRRRGWWGTRQARAPSRAARRQLARENFAADPSRVEGRGVLLVDDVATTMATLSAAAEVLQASGARAVDAWTAARAD